MLEDIVDVCVQSHPLFDEIAYNCWLQGMTIAQAMKKVKAPIQLHSRRGGRSSDEQEKQMLQLYISDQYCNFEILEHFLCHPELATQQNLVMLPRERIPGCIEKYYTLDDVVMREILSKQRLAKSRKDLEDMSQSTGVRLQSVTRQFDNLKRIFAMTEESCPGNVQSFIRDRFKLNSDLSRRYSCLVFLVSCGFALGTKKRITK